MKPLFIVMLALLLGTSCAYADEAELVGAIQRWDSASGRMVVGGRDYRTARDLRVVDEQGRELGRGAVRTGVKMGIVVESGGVLRTIRLFLGPDNRGPIE